MRRRLTRERERALLEALEVHESAGDVATATGLPLRQVIHYQRLYGPPHLQLQRAAEDRERLRQMRHEDAKAAREAQLRPRARGGPKVIAMIERERKERWRR
ncbi:hypothetical protein [Symbiobacterium terraclitae]|uniref:hypothetical protein n=1 Tax=Symbiobacterium terraclitae TaxID=557451 RepID=UPI0035B51004